MYTYHEVWATNSDNEPELMSGSYERSDCVAEIEADRDSLQEQGYSKLRIQSRETEEAPDPEIYGEDKCQRWAH